MKIVNIQAKCTTLSICINSAEKTISAGNSEIKVIYMTLEENATCMTENRF